MKSLDLTEKELRRFFNVTDMDYDQLVEIATRLAKEVSRRRVIELASRNIRLKTRRYFRV